MSGHNRWSKIKHKKEATDAKRSKTWTKVIKELTVSARLGGGDITANPRLRTAVDKARDANMPNDTIDRAIKKGSGDLEGVQYEEFHYGSSAGGTAVLVEIMTDNRNRTEQRDPQRHPAPRRQPGRVGVDRPGCSRSRGWWCSRGRIDEEKLTDQAIELGAEDIRTEGASRSSSPRRRFERIRERLAGGAARQRLPRSPWCRRTSCT
jgi:YebC/PmpR family DNA-binding regulatory protein